MYKIAHKELNIKNQIAHTKYTNIDLYENVTN